MAAAKSCSYCGQENADGATHCTGCGTDVTETPMGLKLRLRGGLGFVRLACWCALTPVAAAILYFLSFGPVSRYWVNRSSPVFTTNAAGFTVKHTVSFPHWVGFVYYPALAVGADDDGLYGRYLRWWERPVTIGCGPPLPAAVISTNAATD